MISRPSQQTHFRLILPSNPQGLEIRAGRRGAGTGGGGGGQLQSASSSPSCVLCHPPWPGPAARVVASSAGSDADLASSRITTAEEADKPNSSAWDQPFWWPHRPTKPNCMWPLISHFLTLSKATSSHPRVPHHFLIQQFSGMETNLYDY